jgi:hypothetical protein
LNLEPISLTGSAASEVARLLPSANDNRLHEDETLEDEYEDELQSLPSSDFPDIQYIQNSQAIPVAFQPFQVFIANDVLDTTAILEIRKSHDAFAHNLQSNSQQIVNINNIATNGNTFNRIITEVTANNVDEVQRRQRRNRWEGRRRLETISNSSPGNENQYFFNLCTI